MVYNQHRPDGKITAGELRKRGIIISRYVPDTAWSTTSDIEVVSIDTIDDKHVQMVVDVPFKDPNILVRLFTIIGD